jgi:hypothetical protein
MAMLCNDATAPQGILEVQAAETLIVADGTE